MTHARTFFCRCSFSHCFSPLALSLFSSIVSSASPSPGSGAAISNEGVIPHMTFLPFPFRRCSEQGSSKLPTVGCENFGTSNAYHQTLLQPRDVDLAEPCSRKDGRRRYTMAMRDATIISQSEWLRLIPLQMPSADETRIVTKI